MSDELPGDLRPIVDFFGLPGTAVVTKDFFVVRAIATIAAIKSDLFALVFGGGTALARAHGLVRRMSEDVDFKIVPKAAAPVSRSILRHRLGALRDQVTQALQAAGFAVDPRNPVHIWSRNESRYTVWQLPYAAEGGSGDGLRPIIQVEMTYAPARRSPVALPVSSFVAEATKQPPEVSSIPCVSVTETAAEKLVALTRRIAMELAGLSRDPDPTLVRHIYDLHMMRAHLDATAVASLARDIAGADGAEFHNQYPAYAADAASETRKALEALQTNPVHAERYDDFVTAMVYGERPEFKEALTTVALLAERIW